MVRKRQVKKIGALRKQTDESIAEEQRKLVEEIEMLRCELGELKNINQVSGKGEGAHQQNDDKFKAFLDDLADLAYITDDKGNITYANKVAQKITEKSLAEIIGKPFLPFFTHDSQPVVNEIYHKSMEGECVEFDARFITDKTYRFKSKPLLDESGKIVGLFGIGRDITGYKQMQEKLQENEQSLWQIVHKTPIPSFVIDKNHTITHWNTACENLTGIPADEVVGSKKQWQAFYAAERPVLADLVIDNAVENEITGYYKGKYHKSLLISDAYECEDFFPDLGEKGKWLFFTAAPLKDAEGKFIGAIETLQDISGRKLSEERLKLLASELTLTEERERRHIATVLHDDITQKLVLFKIKLGLYRDKGLPNDLIGPFEEMYGILDDIIQGSRELTFDLSCPTLYELGLDAAIKQLLANEIEEKHGIATQYQSDGKCMFLEDDLRAILYRSVKELLFNVVKHAHSQNVKVSVSRGDNKIYITVEDDGVGFKDKTDGFGHAEGGFGLFSIRERLGPLGGTLEIQSEQGHGSSVIVTVPLDDNN